MKNIPCMSEVQSQPKERALWAAVIHRAVDDYKEGRLGWAYFNTPDFAKVCELAGTNPRKIRLSCRMFTATLKAKAQRSERKALRAVAA